MVNGTSADDGDLNQYNYKPSKLYAFPLTQIFGRLSTYTAIDSENIAALVTVHYYNQTLVTSAH